MNSLARPSPIASIRSEAPDLREYNSTLEFLSGLLNYERKAATSFDSRGFRLDRMRLLLELLGNPHSKLQILHVAGTKGKGTVSTLLAACLSAHGWRTGLYTSPHLIQLEERFQIDGQIATQEELIALTSKVREVLPVFETSTDSRPTFFEFTTAVALLHFAARQVDYAVLEVGLGGRLDSTNICTPLISVITSISLDHQRQLGNTIPEIAAEKAGIIKQNTPVVTSVIDPAALQVIEQRSREMNAPLIAAEQHYHYQWYPLSAETASLGQSSESTLPVAVVRYLPNDKANSCFGEMSVETPLLGTHQAENIAVAMAVLDLFSRTKSRLDSSTVQAAVARATVPARLQVVARQPLRIIDTAHNPASMRAGLNALATHFPEQPVTALFASSVDKDYRAMLEMLVHRCSRIIVTAFLNNPRSVPPGELAELARELIANSDAVCDVHCLESPDAAWSAGCRFQSSQDLLYATGSFFLAAELLASLGVKHQGTAT